MASCLTADVRALRGLGGPGPTTQSSLLIKLQTDAREAARRLVYGAALDSDIVDITTEDGERRSGLGITDITPAQVPSGLTPLEDEPEEDALTDDDEPVDEPLIPTSLSPGEQMRLGGFSIRCNPPIREGLRPGIAVHTTPGGNFIRHCPTLKDAVDLCRLKAPDFDSEKMVEVELIPSQEWTAAPFADDPEKTRPRVLQHR